MENLNVKEILDDFRNEFNSGNLKKDILPNSFPIFDGEIQQADDDAFDRYRGSKLYKYVLGL